MLQTAELFHDFRRPCSYLALTRLVQMDVGVGAPSPADFDGDGTRRQGADGNDRLDVVAEEPARLGAAA